MPGAALRPHRPCAEADVHFTLWLGRGLVSPCWIGETEVAESLEPLARWEELAGIPSSEIQVLFFFLMLGSCLWAGNARSYQYIIAFTQQIFIIEFLLYA